MPHVPVYGECDSGDELCCCARSATPLSADSSPRGKRPQSAPPVLSDISNTQPQPATPKHRGMRQATTHSLTDDGAAPAARRSCHPETPDRRPETALRSQVTPPPKYSMAGEATPGGRRSSYAEAMFRTPDHRRCTLSQATPATTHAMTDEAATEVILCTPDHGRPDAAQATPATTCAMTDAVEGFVHQPYHTDTAVRSPDFSTLPLATPATSYAMTDMATTARHGAGQGAGGYVHGLHHPEATFTGPDAAALFSQPPPQTAEATPASGPSDADPRRAVLWEMRQYVQGWVEGGDERMRDKFYALKQMWFPDFARGTPWMSGLWLELEQLHAELRLQRTQPAAAACAQSQQRTRRQRSPTRQAARRRQQQVDKEQKKIWDGGRGVASIVPVGAR
eukprot:TRINITY_DN9160_c0_g2_i9.p1 TRINITY_DN9160_c0_g2~~TRINITY_DN9160_c0_g2_i9.p1  ORF type:complete len:420 (+),score=118.76 TRINITY_DN9160_c0_g2_i9:80-1261(+)